jgi:hypothetical protein
MMIDPLALWVAFCATFLAWANLAPRIAAPDRAPGDDEDRP